jgi:hypothetical protein
MKCGEGQLTREGIEWRKLMSADWRRRGNVGYATINIICWQFSNNYHNGARHRRRTITISKTGVCNGVMNSAAIHRGVTIWLAITKRVMAGLKIKGRKEEKRQQYSMLAVNVASERSSKRQQRNGLLFSVDNKWDNMYRRTCNDIKLVKTKQCMKRRKNKNLCRIRLMARGYYEYLLC